jgi:hypothetical protein
MRGRVYDICQTRAPATTTTAAAAGWSVLSDGYLSGARMKDWDRPDGDDGERETEEEEEEEELEDEDDA